MEGDILTEILELTEEDVEPLFRRTEVVNVKVKYIRPEYDNLKIWCKSDDNVYIGRRGIVFVKTSDGGKERFPKQDSMFANPFKVGKKHTLDESLVLYERYMRDRLDSDPDLVRQMLRLEGKRLGCWCKPNRCHGDILVGLISEYSVKN